MKRRDAIKNLMLTSGALLALPAWATNWNTNKLVGLDNVFSDEELTLLTSIVDTIIPSNGTLGGVSVGVEVYLAGLISECFEVDIQDAIKWHMNELNTLAATTNSKDFVDCLQIEREELLLNIGMATGDDKNEFFDFMKSQTIKGFRTSEEVMVNYLDYVLMPGFYDGDVDVEA